MGQWWLDAMPPVQLQAVRGIICGLALLVIAGVWRRLHGERRNARERAWRAQGQRFATIAADIHGTRSQDVSGAVTWKLFAGNPRAQRSSVARFEVEARAAGRRLQRERRADKRVDAYDAWVEFVTRDREPDDMGLIRDGAGGPSTRTYTQLRTLAESACGALANAGS